MGRKVAISLLFIFFGVSQIMDESMSLYAQEGAQERHEPIFILDHNTNEFISVTPSIAAADSLLNLSFQMRNRDPVVSVQAAGDALEIATEINYPAGISRAHQELAVNFLNFGDYSESLEHSFLAMEIAENTDDFERKADLYNIIALVHLEQNNYERATEFFERNIQVWKDIGQEDMSYIAENNIGLVKLRQSNYEDAIQHFERAAELAIPAAGDTMLSMVAVTNLGICYQGLGDYSRASEYLKRAERFHLENEYIVRLSGNYIYQAYLYLEQNDVETGIEYGHKSLQIAEQEQLKDLVRDAHQFLSEAFETIGDYQQALYHNKLFNQLSDSLLDTQRINQINLMQTRFDFEQKNREIELLNQEAELQQARLIQQEQQRGFMIAGLLLLTVIVGLLIYMNKEKKKNNLLLQQRRREIEKQNLELSNLNKEKDEFMSIAAHDLRNPISVIKTAIGFIHSEENLPKNELEEYIDFIQISVDRMLNLINDLLDVQVMNYESREDISELIQIEQPLKQSIAHFQQAAASKQIEIQTEFNSEDSVIMGKLDSLTRIFDNLISNAIKYSPSGSRIFISTYSEEDAVQIRIKDQGEGIGPEDQKKLFKRFSKLSTKPTGNESSTGLGLYIVKKLIDSMNGRLWCESEKGKGAEFIVEFKVRKTTPVS